MKTARLIVKNFGPLKDVNIVVTDFLCLIGKQATGKSTIAKLIAIFEDEYFQKEFFIENLIKYGLYQFISDETFISYKVDENNSKSIFYFDFIFENRKAELNNFKTYFVHLFEDKKIKNLEDAGKKLKLTGEISKLFLNEFRSDNEVAMVEKFKHIIKDFQINMNNEIQRFDENSLNILKPKLGISKIDVFSERVINTIDVFYKKIIEFLKLDSLYIPSERNFLHIIAENTLGLINNNIQIPKHLLEIGQEYEKALNVVKEIPLALIDKKFTYKREGKTSYIYHSKEEKVDLLQSASGLQSVLPIMLLVEYAKTLKDNYHFNYIIEEPELNIYPETQHQLIKYLVQNIFDFKVNNFQRKKLVITTHSPYILASINNLLLAFKKGQEIPLETNKIIKKASWINPIYFNAYELRNGKSYKIFNDKLGQIKSNIIDKVSDDFSDEFDKLLAL